METQEKTRKFPPEKWAAMNRAERRSQIRHGSGGMLSRVPSGVRTGQTPHFTAWMADLNAKRILWGMKVDRLAERMDGRIGATFAILRAAGGFKNVWELSQANAERLLSVPKLGPARLKEVEQHLRSKNVPLKWTMP